MRLFTLENCVSLQSSLFTTALIGTLALLGGCSTFDSTWKSTKAFYGEYINPPAKIDYEDKGVLNDAETRLASRMVGIDIQLEQLERFLQNADRPPTGESVAILFHRFPWLSGLAAVDAEGTVLAQEPPAAMKELDFSRMLEQKPRGGELRGLRGLVEDTPLGPEVLTGIPVYSGSEMMGLLVAHFDMRSLLTYTSGAEDLVVLSPQGILWPGRFVVDATPLTGQDWNEITRDSTHGTVSNKTGSFIWMARFIGEQPLIFATPSEGQFPEDAEQLSALSHASAFSSQGMTAPVTESQVMEGGADGDSILTAPLPPVRGLGMQESSIEH